MPFVDASDSIVVELTLEGRNLVARKKHGDVVYRVLGWQLGRGGYDDSNPVKIIPITENATLAQASIQVTDNSFDVGDQFFLNGAPFIVNQEWTPGVNIEETVRAMRDAVRFSRDDRHHRLVEAFINSGSTDTLQIRALVPGAIMNSFDVSAGDNTPTTNFSVTPMAGGVSQELIDPAFPAPPNKQTFADPYGDLEQPSPESVSHLIRVPSGSDGLSGFGEVGIWVEVLDSNFDDEVGREVLFANGHMPLKTKTDRDILNWRIVVAF